MRKLTTFTDFAAAGEFRRVLGEAGIQTQITTELAGPWGTPAQIAIWVEDDADQAIIHRVCAGLAPAESPQGAARPTRVCVADEQVRCLECGYDLRGQIGDGKCPECGHPYHVIAMKNCRSCGAEMPDDFDICWNCGGDIPHE